MARIGNLSALLDEAEGPEDLARLVNESLDSQRQEYARRSGVDAALIDVWDWSKCDPFDRGDTNHNCAYSLLNTADVPLPDHLCAYVTIESFVRYRTRRGQSVDEAFEDDWQYVLSHLPEGHGVSFVIERVRSYGSVTLFGVVEWRQEGEGRHARWKSTFVEPHVMTILSTATAAERKALGRLEGLMRQWYGHYLLSTEPPPRPRGRQGGSSQQFARWRPYINQWLTNRRLQSGLDIPPEELRQGVMVWRRRQTGEDLTLPLSTLTGWIDKRWIDPALLAARWTEQER